MRKVILYVAVSADGYIARENGDVDWLDAYHGDFGYKEFMSRIDTVVMGYGTFEKSLSFGDPDIFKGHAYYIFTRNHTDVTHDDVEFVTEEPREFMERLKNTSGKDIWLMGGGQLVRSFLEADLVDEIMIFMIPTILGSGIPLFPPPARQLELTLINTESYEEGVTLLHYEVPRD